MTPNLMVGHSNPHTRTLSAISGPMVDVPPLVETMEDAMAMADAPPHSHGPCQTLSVALVSTVEPVQLRLRHWSLRRWWIHPLELIVRAEPCRRPWSRRW